jgi:hypothetical protein
MSAADETFKRLQSGQMACNKIFISISGLIGAGKTTLANALGKEMGLKVYEEPVTDNVCVFFFFFFFLFFFRILRILSVARKLSSGSLLLPIDFFVCTRYCLLLL